MKSIKQVNEDMKTIKMKNIIALSLIIILTGCAQKPKTFVPLTEPMKANISKTDLYVVDCPEKIGFDIERSNITAYTGGGLLFALVDAAIESNRTASGEKALECVHTAFKGIPVQNMLDNTVIPVIQKANWIDTATVHHVKDLDEKKLQVITDQSRADTNMVAVFDYRFNTDLSTLTGVLHIALYPKSDTLKKMAKTKKDFDTPIFKTHIAHSKHLTMNHEDLAKNAKSWANGNGIYLKECLESVIQEIAKGLETALMYPQHVPES